MSKGKKKEPKPKKERANKYDEKLAVNGSFLNIMQAAVKDADNKSAKQKP